MTTRPVISPLFATDATLGTGVESALPPRLDPGAGVRARGLLGNTRAPGRWFNFVLGLLGDWASYLDQKTAHCYNPLNFGAVPGTGDSTAALQATIDAAGTGIGGGNVVVPGEFRHTGLAIHPGVNFYGVPGISRLNHNHATNHALTWTGNSRQNFTEINGVSLCAAIDSTGHAIHVGSGNLARLRLTNCAINDELSGGAFKGRLVFCQGAGSLIAADHSYVAAAGNASADAFFMGGADGILQLDHNRIIMPATYSSQLIEIDDGRLLASHNNFDVTAHSGSANIIDLLSVGYHVLKNNEFHGAFSSGACIKAFGGTKISETGSVFDTVNAYDISGGALALGSELTLQNPIATTVSGTGTFTCATGYRAQSVKFTSTSFGTTGPLIVLPAILFIGQRFTLTVFNAGDDSWTNGFSISGAVVPSPNPLTLSNIGGNVRTLTFVALDANADGTPFWVIEGDPSTGYAAS